MRFADNSIVFKGRGKNNVILQDIVDKDDMQIYYIPVIINNKKMSFYMSENTKNDELYLKFLEEICEAF